MGTTFATHGDPTFASNRLAGRSEERRVGSDWSSDVCSSDLQNSQGGDLTKVFEKLKSADGHDVRDAWGSDLRIEPVGWYQNKTHYIVRSAGADQQFNSGDDMVAYLQVGNKSIIGGTKPGSSYSSINLNIEHDRGPFNGLAQIAGTVTDPTGAVITAASVRVRAAFSGKTRTAKTNAAG